MEVLDQSERGDESLPSIAPDATVLSVDCNLSSLLDMLERVEELPQAACGALLLKATGDHEGTIYIEHGRLCWAVAHGMRKRLTDLVLQEAGDRTSRDQLEALYDTCRASGRPLGQTLVQERIITADGLRSALARHTAEALNLMSSWSRPECHWLDRGESSYDAMFTFDTVEISAEVSSLSQGLERRRREDELRAVVPKGAFAAAFVWPTHEREQLPVAVLGSGEHSIQTAVELGKWACNQLGLAGAVAETCHLMTAASNLGGAVVTWTSEAGFYTALCESSSVLARLLSNYTRLRSHPRGT